MDVHDIRRARMRQLVQEAESQKAFADRLKTAASTVSRWLKDPDAPSAKNIGEKKARDIEQLLGKPRNWLDEPLGSATYPTAVLTRPETASELPPAYGASSARRVFVVGKGQGGLAERVWTDGDYPIGATDEYADVATTDRHAFLIRVEGASMSPRYMPGEYALVEPSVEPDIEDDVLVRLRTGETMLKRLISKRGGITLGSYNEPGLYTFKLAEIAWTYYVAHPVPSRKIKSRL